MKPLPLNLWPAPEAPGLEFCFAIRNGLLSDQEFLEVRDLMYGPETAVDELFTPDLPEMLVRAGVFSSKGQARKAGAPSLSHVDGLQLYIVGKLKTRIWVWEPRQSNEGSS